MQAVSLYKWQTAKSFKVKVLAARQAAVFIAMPWLDVQSQLKEGQLHTSSIALEGALIEVVACSQHGLQQVDEALAGTHLLAPHLQHLQLLPHLPPQTVSCHSCYQDVYQWSVFAMVW